jgi:hypothetical protein
MDTIKYTLIADGGSDKVLMRVIKWLLDDLYPKIPNEGVFADFRKAKLPPETIKEKVAKSQEYYPFDVLFYHRDAEKRDRSMLETRTNEVKTELSTDILEKTIFVIPIKMMETWLLIDENAIKKAAGNRNYKEKITLPSIKKLEKESNPKILLHSLLRNVSNLKGRNLKKFNVHQAVHLVAENIENFNILRKLDAFKAFEKELKTVMKSVLKNKNNII